MSHRFSRKSLFVSYNHETLNCSLKTQDPEGQFTHGGNDGQNVCSKDRGVGKEPSIAQVQLRSTGNHILLMISSNGKLNQKLRYKKRKGPNKDRVEVNKIHRNLQRDKKTNSWINKIHKPLARLISKKKRHKLPILAMQ